MINDKMAKMAINTLKEYCKNLCSCCAVYGSCGQKYCYFKNVGGYNDVGTFEDLQESPQKTPKFDTELCNGNLYQDYLNEIFAKEANEAGLLMDGLHKIRCYPNGTIKAWYTDDDGETVYKGKAKCHPNDAFNPEIGVKLAVQRIAEKINKPFVPTDGETYYYVGNDAIHIYVNHYENKDVFNIALGNCFKTFEQADAHKDVITKRIAKAAKLLKKLRDEGDE